MVRSCGVGGRPCRGPILVHCGIGRDGCPSVGVVGDGVPARGIGVVQVGVGLWFAVQTPSDGQGYLAGPVLPCWCSDLPGVVGVWVGGSAWSRPEYGRSDLQSGESGLSGCGSGRVGSLSELTVGVVAPGMQGACRVDAKGVAHPHGGPLPCEVRPAWGGDGDWPGPIGIGAVAELAARVASPGVESASGNDGLRGLTPGRDSQDIGIAGHIGFGGQGVVGTCIVVADLAVPAGTECVNGGGVGGGVGCDGKGVVLACGQIQPGKAWGCAGRGAYGRGGGRGGAGLIVSQLAVGVVAPGVQGAVVGYGEGVIAAGLYLCVDQSGRRAFGHRAYCGCAGGAACRSASELAVSVVAPGPDVSGRVQCDGVVVAGIDLGESCIASSGKAGCGIISTDRSTSELSIRVVPPGPYPPGGVEGCRVVPSRRRLGEEHICRCGCAGGEGASGMGAVADLAVGVVAPCVYLSVAGNGHGMGAACVDAGQTCT